jgi:hypothetical protein
MAQSPSEVPGGRLGSRDGWGEGELRSSIVHVETAIPVRAARWAVERWGSGALRRCCGRKPVEWDAGSDFTAWTSGDGVQTM